MVEWNGIFRLFRFSGILGQPREVHPKFRGEFLENETLDDIAGYRYSRYGFWLADSEFSTVIVLTRGLVYLWSMGSSIFCYYIYCDFVPKASQICGARIVKLLSLFRTDHCADSAKKMIAATQVGSAICIYCKHISGGGRHSIFSWDFCIVCFLCMR